MTTEVRTTSSTGGQKGVKPQRHSLIPKEGIDTIAEVFAFGAEKYADHNWRKGYEWSKSYDALIRHLTAWFSGEDLDSESGLSHLGHAGFHVMALATWQRTGLYDEFDDRYRPASESAAEEEERLMAEQATFDEADEPLTIPRLPKELSDYYLGVKSRVADRFTLTKGVKECPASAVIAPLLKRDATALERVGYWSKRVIEGEAYAEENPGDPHLADEGEYAQEELRHALEDLTERGRDYVRYPANDGWESVGWVDPNSWSNVGVGWFDEAFVWREPELPTLKAVQERINQHVKVLGDLYAAPKLFIPPVKKITGGDALVDQLWALPEEPKFEMFETPDLKPYIEPKPMTTRRYFPRVIVNEDCTISVSAYPACSEIGGPRFFRVDSIGATEETNEAGEVYQSLTIESVGAAPQVVHSADYWDREPVRVAYDEGIQSHAEPQQVYNITINGGETLDQLRDDLATSRARLQSSSRWRG